MYTAKNRTLYQLGAEKKNCSIKLVKMKLKLENSNSAVFFPPFNKPELAPLNSEKNQSQSSKMVTVFVSQTL